MTLLFPESDAVTLRQAWADLAGVLDRYEDCEAKVFAVQQVLGRAGVRLLRAIGDDGSGRSPDYFAGWADCETACKAELQLLRSIVDVDLSGDTIAQPLVIGTSPCDIDLDLLAGIAPALCIGGGEHAITTGRMRDGDAMRAAWLCTACCAGGWLPC